jgi:hypothetical protein
MRQMPEKGGLRATRKNRKGLSLTALTRQIGMELDLSVLWYLRASFIPLLASKGYIGLSV